ncbi:hypothetical protein KKG41_03225 [Patescibacteria group bacterium]|nr:hypothetical protein [Patescibacteria group bacterium]
MKTELEKFLQIVDSIYGLYLDAVAAFIDWSKALENGQKQIMSKEGKTIEQLDNLPFAYTDQDFPNAHIKHSRSIGDVKNRNKKGGGNHVIMANLCLVLIYQYWEIYRTKLETILSFPKNHIKSNLMADVKYLRNSILKHDGIGNHEMKKCKIILWFKEGQLILLNQQRFEIIIQLINDEILSINKKYGV